MRTRRWIGAGLVVALSASATVALAARHDGDRDPSASPAAGAGLVLRPLDTARGCTPARQVELAVAPASVRQALAVLRSARHSDDGLPVLNRADGAGSEDQGWLAVRTYDGRGVRRAGAAGTAAYVVPSAAVLKLVGAQHGAACPSRLRAPSAGGACLVVGPPGGPFRTGCWTLAQIRAGRALGLDGRRLVGLRPDGVAAMSVRGRRGVTAVRPGSVIGQSTPLRAGDRVAVALRR